MFAKRCRILHTSRIRKRRHKDTSCVRAPSVVLVVMVPQYSSRLLHEAIVMQSFNYTSRLLHDATVV